MKLEFTTSEQVTMISKFQRRSFISKAIGMLPGTSLLKSLPVSIKTAVVHSDETGMDKAVAININTLALPSCTEHLHVQLALICLNRLFWDKPLRQFHAQLNLRLRSIEQVLVRGLSALTRQQMDAMSAMVQAVISKHISMPRIFASTMLFMDVSVDRRTRCRVFPPESFVLPTELEDEMLVEKALARMERHARFTMALRENHTHMFAVMMKVLGKLNADEVLEQVRHISTNTTLGERADCVQGLISEWHSSLNTPMGQT